MSFLIRFRYLSSYKALRELPLGKPSALELHPDVNKAEEPTAFHNYLDEFLQAVRVFGFLEKPVFHELARHLQTRRLIAGDTLSLGADKNFYCVVDGTVQVFAPPGSQQDGDVDDNWDTDMNGYQLLNEVGSGGTLSSLFTILSLFTEDIQLRWSDTVPTPASNVALSPASSASRPSSTLRKRGRYNSDVSQMDLGDSVEGSNISSPPVAAVRRKGSVVSQSSISSASTVHVSQETPTISVPGLDTATYDEPDQDWTPNTWSPPSEGSPGTPHHTSSRQDSDYFGAPRNQRPKARKSSTLQQGTIARATTDATLAVIPAEAFRRLTQKYPKASAHIVQGMFVSQGQSVTHHAAVILTRFSRVTFQSAHKYLGLTSELLRTEKAINDIACHPLPRTFYEGGGIESLRQRFQYSGPTNGESVGSEEESDYFNQTSDDSRTHLLGKKGSNSTAHSRRGTIGRTLTGNASLASNSTAIPSTTLKMTNGVLATSPNEIPIRPASAIPQLPKQPGSSSGSPITPFKPTASRTAVHAGDLHTSTGRLTDAIHGLNRSSLNIPYKPRRLSGSSSSVMREAGRMQSEDFDLREEVMSCIAKSIGLLQPPLSAHDSTQASPMPFGGGSEFSKSGPSQASAMFNPSFSSLLQGDDAASSLSSSILSASQGAGYMTGLDNEVEILSFPAGALIVKASEKNAGT